MKEAGAAEGEKTAGRAGELAQEIAQNVSEILEAVAGAMTGRTARVTATFEGQAKAGPEAGGSEEAGGDGSEEAASGNEDEGKEAGGNDDGGKAGCGQARLILDALITLILDIDDEYLAGEMARNRKLAGALEHVLRKTQGHLGEALPFQIYVDARGQRRAREERLRETAREVASKVAASGRPIVLDLRDSDDRRIFEAEVERDARVQAKRLETGAQRRKLMVLPKGSAAPGRGKIIPRA